MKKSLLIAALFITFSSVAEAQTSDTTGRQTFYYYPQQNVYFSPKSNSYFYPNSDGTTWQSVNQFPANYDINSKSEKTLIYYNGTDLWKNNSADIKQYGKQQPTSSGALNSTIRKQ